MRWAVGLAMVALCGCPKLLPPPADIDAYCRGVLSQGRGVPPECQDTADDIARRARGEFTRDETLAELAKTNPYAACMERAADARRDCRFRTSMAADAARLIETTTGVPPHVDYAAREAMCDSDFAVSADVCRAHATGGGR